MTMVGRVKRSGPDTYSTHVGSDYRLEPTYGETKFLELLIHSIELEALSRSEQIVTN